MNVILKQSKTFFNTEKSSHEKRGLSSKVINSNILDWCSFGIYQIVWKNLELTKSPNYLVTESQAYCRVYLCDSKSFSDDAQLAELLAGSYKTFEVGFVEIYWNTVYIFIYEESSCRVFRR